MWCRLSAHLDVLPQSVMTRNCLQTSSFVLVLEVVVDMDCALIAAIQVKDNDSYGEVGRVNGNIVHCP